MTSTDQRVAELRLRMKTEKQSITDAKSQLRSLQGQFVSFKEESERTNRTLEQQARALQQQQLAAKTSNAEIAKFAAQERAAQSELNRTTDAVDRQTQSLRARYEAARQANEAPLPDTLTIGGGSGLQTAGTQLFRLPATPIPGTNISTDVLGRVLNALGRLGASFDTLLAAAPPAAIAIGLLATGIQSFKAQIQPVIDLLNQLKAARLDVAGAIAEGPEAVIAKFKEADNQLKQYSAQLASLTADQKTFSDDQQRQLEILQNASITDVKTRSAASLQYEADKAQVVDYQNQIDALTPKIAAQRATLHELTPAYEEATGAMRDQRIEQERAALQDKQRTERIQLLGQISSFTTEQIDKRIQADRDQQAALQAYIDAGLGSEAFLAGLRQQFALLGTEISVLSYEIRPVVDQREKEAAAAKKLLDALNSIPGAVQAATDSFKRIQDAARKLTRVDQNFKEKIQQITDDATDKVLEAQRKRDIDLSEAQRDADMARDEAIRKSGLDRAKLEQDTQDKIKKILRRAKYDEQNAIQDRNAVALDEARRRKKDELANEQEAALQRQQELDDNLKEQLRTINIRLKEQQRTINIRYSEQERTIRKAAQKSIETERKRYDQEIKDAQRAYQEVLKAEYAKHAGEIQAAIDGKNAVLNVAAGLWAGLVNQAAAAKAAANQRPATVSRPPQPTPTNPNPAVFPGTRIPQLASGGYIQREGMAYLHAGETVVRRGQGGFTFAPTINGNSKRQIKRQIERELDKFLSDWERGS